MSTHTIYYATNRRHQGADRWHPTGYGTRFSDDGAHNLRFGRVSVEADPKRIDRFLAQTGDTLGPGDGESLSGYLAKARHAETVAYEERPAQVEGRTDLTPGSGALLGSAAAFDELRQDMLASNDVVLYIHGFNVSWKEAVASALALQIMLNREGADRQGNNVRVVLFSWPSEGKAYPFVSYRGDRKDAALSGEAVGRGLLKVHDLLSRLRAEAVAARKAGEEPELCKRELHLLSHSMGNYVLQNALAAMLEERANAPLPRLFAHLFLCAADVDADVLEAERAMGRLHELAGYVNVYHNRGDAALVVSDVTKGNPERLGHAGAARPALLHNKVHQIDCTPIVSGLAEHSYYLCGRVNDDIRLSIAGLTQDDPGRPRQAVPNAAANLWRMTEGG